MRDEDVEVGWEESPDGNRVVEIIVASGAEVDEVFEGIEIGHVNEILTLEFVELEGEVSWGLYTAKGGGGRTRGRSGLEMTRVTCLPWRPQSQHFPFVDSMTRARVVGSMGAGVFSSPSPSSAPSFVRLPRGIVERGRCRQLALVMWFTSNR